MIQESYHSKGGHWCSNIDSGSSSPLDISELWIAFGTGKAFRYTGPTQLYYISVKEPHLKIDTLKLNSVFTSPLDNKFSYTELCACVSRRMCTIKKDI